MHRCVLVCCVLGIWEFGQLRLLYVVELVEEFFVAFCNHSGANIHVNLAYGDNLHHIIEAIFKALGRALDDATGLDPRIETVMSSKGMLE